MATVLEPKIRVKEVHIEGLALLKIVKHCHDSLPQMVTGSLLGLVNSETGGVLEVTHAFAFPESGRAKDARSAAAALAGGGDVDAADNDTNNLLGMEGHEYQLEMMRMLREVNVDNNCVGWYQSMYLGIYSTAALLENQFSYQSDLSPNAVVILYDPMQTAHGQLLLHCYRLTDECLQYKSNPSKNAYIDPSRIFEEIPVRLTNPGLVRALLADIIVTDTSSTASLLQGNNTITVHADTTFDRLDLSTNPYLEKHLEFLCSWVDDLAAEQQKFQYYTRQLNQQRGRSGNAASGEEEGWSNPSAPRRMESLLISNQIRSYCNQMDQFAGGSLGKLFLAGGLHSNDEDNKKQQQAAATN